MLDNLLISVDMRHIQGDQRDTRMREKMNNLKQDFKNSMTAVYLQNKELLILRMIKKKSLGFHKLLIGNKDYGLITLSITQEDSSPDTSFL